MAGVKRQAVAARDREPLLRLYTLWQRQCIAAEVCGADDELANHRAGQLAQTERQIAEARAETAAGLFARLAIYEHHLLTTINVENPDGVEQLALSLIRDVRRLLR